jgi:uncharacterized protein YgiM (DUF1202 family)
MKTSRTVMESIAVAALAVSMMITAVTGDRVLNTQEDKAAAKEAVALNTYEDEAYADVSVEKMDVELLAAAVSGETEDTTEEAVSEVDSESTETSTASTRLTDEEKAWQNKLMAKVKTSLNVRAKASAGSKIVGKMAKGDVATIIKAGKKWTKIKSGKVTGYVRNSYCVTGKDALNYAKKVCDVVAKSTTDGLHVREEQDIESAVIKTVSAGDKLVVDDETETSEDWVAVKVSSDTCYVSSEYVDVKLDTGKATKVKKEKAKTTGTVYSATSDEVKLLAAIAECEVGGVSEKCMTAVAAVVLNRVKSSLYPNDIKSVIYQRSQFGPASSGKLARKLSSGVSASAMRAAKAALNGSDPTNGGKYFKLASSGKSGVVIGPVVFY